VRVAVNKMDGVESVDVTLKRGVAHIRLREGNAVTLAQLRRVIKDAGYSSREAVVTAIGRVTTAGGRRVLAVTGTDETFRLEPDAAAPQAAASPAPATAIVEVQGTVPAPDAAHAVETLRVRSLTVRQ
jgi:hypothetical protein